MPKMYGPSDGVHFPPHNFIIAISMTCRPVSLLALLLVLQLLLSSHTCWAAEQMTHELMGMLKQVDYLSERNDYERALPIIEAAVKKYPNSYDARVKRGFVLSNLEEEEKGIEDYLWALKQRPNDSVVAQHLATAYYQMSKLEPALKYINLALANSDSKAKTANYFMIKKDIFRQMRRCKEAQQCVSEAVKLFPAPHWYLERLKLAAINGDWKTVLSDSEHLLPLMPKFNPKILQLRAQGLVGLKRYEEAEKLLNDLIKKTPDNRDFLMERSKLYAAIGKKDLAQKDLKTVKQIDESL